MKSNIIGLDIAKNVFHLYTVREDGKFSRKCFDVNKYWRFLPIAQVA